MANRFNIDNVPIAGKIGGIVACFVLVSVVSVSFALSQMDEIRLRYADVVNRIGPGATNSADAERQAVTYLSRGYQLVVETTDEGNARLLRESNESRVAYLSVMGQVLATVPEQADRIAPVVASFGRVFAACDPVIRYAASVTSNEDNLKAALRLKAECSPALTDAIGDQVRLVQQLHNYAAQISDELTARAAATFRTSVIAVSVGLLLATAAALWVGLRGLSRPVVRLNAAMAAIAGEDLEVAAPGVDRGDEIGAMARTVDVFKAKALEVRRLRADQEAQKARAAAERRQAMLGLAADFEAGVGGITGRVSAQAAELQTTSQAIAARSEAVSRQATAIAAASEQATRNVTTVAAAADELAVSVRDIMQQVARSDAVIQAAVRDAGAAGDTFQGLSTAVQRITEVISLIKGIAGQTNLLALNATIEAARAGEAGKGFAVVASEVKALANQTARATGDISEQIGAIQQATEHAVRAIDGIAEQIGRVSEAASGIAAAVEEQGAATQAIAQNVAEAARGTGEVNTNIAGVSAAASGSGTAAGELLAHAGTLARDSASLAEQVQRFVAQVRAA